MIIDKELELVKVEGGVYYARRRGIIGNDLACWKKSDVLSRDQINIRATRIALEVCATTPEKKAADPEAR